MKWSSRDKSVVSCPQKVKIVFHLLCSKGLIESELFSRNFKQYNLGIGKIQVWYLSITCATGALYFETYKLPSYRYIEGMFNDGVGINRLDSSELR